MQIISTSAELIGVLAQRRKQNPGFKLGFVPTMGALHKGHLKLIDQAKATTDGVICSVFVNPTQFNDPKDLERYPRTLDADTELLKDHNCDYLFVPSVEEVYPDGTNAPYSIDFAGIDKGMEGRFRPGHFKGVAMVVERLFDLVKPDVAFFGKKDFQQVAIIKQMVRLRKLPVTIAVVETARSADGLALSSRNALLSDEQKTEALIISKTLYKAKELARVGEDAVDLKKKLIDFFNTGNLRLEYLEIVDELSLQPLGVLKKGATCCIAAFCGKVRLIDNMTLV